MLLLDAFGIFLAVTLAFAVWGPDMWRWITTHIGMREPLDENQKHFGFD